MEIKSIQTEKGTATIQAIIPNADVQTEKDHVVSEMIQTVSVKGFRKGKAPRSIAEKSLDPSQLSDHILNHIVSHLLEHVVEENKFRLLGRPVLDTFKVEKDGSWNLVLKLPLYPNIKLGKYKEYLKSIPKKNRKVEDIYTSLLDHEKIDISELVITEEVNYSLQRLTTQAKQLNLPLEDYLKAIGKTLDQVKQEYADSASKTVRLDLILIEIAKEQNIDTDDNELVELLKVSNLPNSSKNQLRSVINRRKTIDYLMKL